MRRALLIAVLALAGAGVAAASTAAPPITVYAASSLTDVFPKIDGSPRYSFAGSNTLAAQIQQGAPADVFASANTALPAQLHAKGLCSKPLVFARNALAIVVPTSNPAHIHGVHDLAKRGVKVDIAGSGVPVGSYTLQVLRNMHLAAAVLRNVVSRETDVRAVLAKVALGEADAGFVYSSDARTVPGKVTTIGLPASAEPKLRYGICVVSSSSHRRAAAAFVAEVLGRRGQAKLLADGFLARAEKQG